MKAVSFTNLRNRKLTCDHFLESLNGMSMNDTEMGIRILFMINKHFHTIRYCYNYLRLYTRLLTIIYYYTLTMIRSAILGAILGPLWGSLSMVVPRPYSLTPQNRMIILSPAHTIGRGWPPLVLRNQGWGGE